MTTARLKSALHELLGAPGRGPAERERRSGATVPAHLSLGELAARLGLPLPDDPALATTAFPTRRVARNDVLYRGGDPFEAIYLVCAGMFKTVLVDAAGFEQVLAFPLAGDVIGIDGIDSGLHPSEAVALERSDVAIVHFARIAHLAQLDRAIARLLNRVLGRELERKHAMMGLLGTLHAEARVAAFLLELSARQARLGRPGDTIDLRMTRGELGSHLGVKLETVSRALSTFAAAGLIRVERRIVTLRDPKALRQILERESAKGRAAPHLQMVRSAAPAPPA